MNRIKELREARHMSQVRLSIELGVSQETVSAYEKEKYYPSYQSLLKLSEIFHASIDYIMGRSDQMHCPNELSAQDQEALILLQELRPHQKEIAIAYLIGMIDATK